MWFTPTKNQVQWVGQVFGPKGVQVLSQIEFIKDGNTAEGTYCLSAGSHWPGCVQVIFAKKDETNPFIFIHEIAHAYHSFYFAHLTELCDPAKAEACALLAEHTLSAFLPEHPDILQRQQAWERSAEVSEEIAEAKILAERALQDRAAYDWSLHKVFELILFGVYDGDEKCHAYI